MTTLLSSRLSRGHKKLSGYSKAELDKAESYLQEKKLLKTPLVSWLFYAVIPLEALFEEQLDKLSEINEYMPLFMIILPIFIGLKIKENHNIRVALDYLKTSKKIDPSKS